MLGLGEVFDRDGAAAVPGMNERAGAIGLQRIDQRIALAAIVLAPDKGFDRESPRRTAEVLDQRFIALRNFVDRESPPAAVIAGYRLEGDAPEAARHKFVPPAHPKPPIPLPLLLATLVRLSDAWASATCVRVPRPASPFS